MDGRWPDRAARDPGGRYNREASLPGGTIARPDVGNVSLLVGGDSYVVAPRASLVVE
jgi:hypothetical protein